MPYCTGQTAFDVCLFYFILLFRFCELLLLFLLFLIPPTSEDSVEKCPSQSYITDIHSNNARALYYSRDYIGRPLHGLNANKTMTQRNVNRTIKEKIVYAFLLSLLLLCGNCPPPAFMFPAYTILCSPSLSPMQSSLRQ